MKNQTITKKLNRFKKRLERYKKGITKYLRVDAIKCIFKIEQLEKLLIASLAKVKKEKKAKSYTATDYFQQINIYKSFSHHGFKHLVIEDFERFLRELLIFMNYPKDYLKLLLFENFGFEELSKIDADQLWIILHGLDLKLRDFISNKRKQLSLFEV